MASYHISNFWEELKCPICLDFLTCATSIECGHNFCARCIHEFITKTSKSTFKCPKCKKKCVKILRPTRQLEAVVQSCRLLTSPVMRNWKLRDVIKRKFREDISLDPETAYSEMVLSKNTKTMRERNTWYKLQHTMERPDLCGGVLAAQSFMSGRHYWEVTVGNSSSWDVGLCKNSIKRTEDISPSSSNGYWLLSLRKKNYFVCTIPRTIIPLPKKLHKVGIFLDYEVGDIVFYDVDSRCHIYTFTSSFVEPLWPIFSVGLSSKGKNSLSIHPIPEEAAETPECA